MTKKILVVEDDPAALRLVQRILEYEGYEVIPAKNGLEGLRKAQTNDLDLIISDVMMPGSDGFELCQRLRAEPRTSRLPIIMLSAKSREVDKATGLKAGADDYLTKPVKHSEIVSRVEALLAEKAGHVIAQRTRSEGKMQ